MKVMSLAAASGPVEGNIMLLGGTTRTFQACATESEG